MVPDKPAADSGPSKDELQRRLQESLKKKRPRRSRLMLAFLLFVFASLALIVWAFYPQGEPPLVIVTAFDDLGIAGTKVTLQGCLEAAGDAPAMLAGKDMAFVDAQVPLIPDQEAKEIPAITGPHGEAACQWTFQADTAEGNFILRQVGGKFHPGTQDRGLIFLVPAAAPLCLVQIEDTLTDAASAAWSNENIHDIDTAPGAGAALQELAKKGYQMVYVTLAKEPILYQRVRGWIRRQSAEARPPFPAGPVVSRLALPWADHDNRPWQKTAERLAKRFALPNGAAPAQHMAIAGAMDVAQQFQAAGLHTLYLGAGEGVPAGVQRVSGWAGLGKGPDN